MRHVVLSIFTIGSERPPLVSARTLRTPPAGLRTSYRPGRQTGIATSTVGPSSFRMTIRISTIWVCGAFNETVYSIGNIVRDISKVLLLTLDTNKTYLVVGGRH